MTPAQDKHIGRVAVGIAPGLLLVLFDRPRPGDVRPGWRRLVYPGHGLLPRDFVTIINMPRIVENLRILLGIGVLGMAMGLNGCSIGYIARQSIAQASLLLKQEPLDSAIARLPSEKADTLRYAREVKTYAVRQLGLKETGSYERYVDLDGNALTNVVSASRRDRLEPYMWTFPIVGAVPYKGFFDKAEADKERQVLEAAGYDVHVRGVAAFSLLGFMADPLYSTMLQYPRDGLANIIVHELTHATVFLAGNPTFNEGFASFVGNSGSLEFLRERFGADALEVRAAEDSNHDDQVFARFIQDTLGGLKAYYARTDLTFDQKMAGREALFEGARNAYDALPLRRKSHRGLRDAKLTNAYFLLFDTYQRDLSKFERIRGHFSSLKDMVAFFREKVAKQKDPEAFLADWEARAPK